MFRYGAQVQEMRSMQPSEIFMQQLKLLIIMTKAFLKGNPLGDFRKDAIIDTAQFLFYEALCQASQMQPFDSEAETRTTFQCGHKKPDHIFLQRVQLLAVMANSFGKGKNDGNYRKKAMGKNIDLICTYLSDQVQLADAKFLKVA